VILSIADNMNRNISDEWKSISEQPRIALDVIALFVLYLFN